MAAKVVTRKVYFFRIIVPPNEDGSVPPLSIAGVSKSIQKLRFLRTTTSPSSRYARLGSSLVCAWPSNPRLELGRIRRDELPLVERAGKRSPLPISPDDSVVDTTHIRFFPKNIVGAEFNFYGPRASAFCAYCADKFPALPRFRLEPLLNHDAAKQLDELEDIRLLSVRVRASDSELLKSMNESVPGMIDALSQQYGAEAVDIVIRARSRRPLTSAVFGAARAMLRKSRNPTEDFEHFSVRGLSEDSGKVEAFDLLRDRLISEEAVAKVPGRSRAVDSASMFSAIESAYNKRKVELEKAASLTDIDK